MAVVSFDQRSLAGSLTALRARWEEYRGQGSFEQFVEFTLALDCVTETLNRLKLPGLLRQCEGLETIALSLFGDSASHPIGRQDAAALERQIETLIQSIEMSHPGRKHAEPEHRRGTKSAQGPTATDWVKPRAIWMVAQPQHAWVPVLTEQLGFFGFRVGHMEWGGSAPKDPSPLVVLLLPGDSGYGPDEYGLIRRLRTEHPTSQLFALAVPKSLAVMIELLRAGADVTIQSEQETVTVLGRVLDLIQSQERDPFRVLVVEDSATAVTMIRRSLAQHGIDSHPIGNPQLLLDAVEQYRPDLVLMDMYMPHCTGVEATRVLRQLAPYQSLPVVYLSSETDIGMQVEALRLGGDQFLTKPFNPVVLAAVVKTKIERYREMLRSSQLDGLTGLLNHSTTKSRLNQLVRSMKPAGDRLCVVMLDIDHFKSVNDTYGHPVGDQVIRSLAWLLKGRLRTSDIIGRYGGEEFLIVLPGASMDEAQAVIESIRADFATLPHAYAAGTLRVTFSAGVADFPRYANGNDLTHAADAALLRAKQLGRNCVVRSLEVFA